MPFQAGSEFIIACLRTQGDNAQTESTIYFVTLRRTATFIAESLFYTCKNCAIVVYLNCQYAVP